MSDSSGGNGAAGENGDEENRADGDGDSDEEPSTEDEIRWAAYGVLVEEGFDAFTTQKVADAAGVSQSLVHYYYETKADLVYAMFVNGLDQLTDAVETQAETDDPRERILELARFTLRGKGIDDEEEAVEFARFLLEVDAQAAYDERLRETVAYDLEYLREYVADAVREGIDEGQFRAVDPEAFAAVFVAAIRSGQNWRGVFGDVEYVEPVIAGLEAIVDDYLVREDRE